MLDPGCECRTRLELSTYFGLSISTPDGYPDSSCGQRSFWRCERKNECPARVHTNPFTNQIIKRIHSHSHEPPNPEELPRWLLLKQDEGNTPPPEDHPPSAVSCVTSTNSECDSAVDNFLESIRMGKYKSIFAKFSMEVLLSLSAEELGRLCRNDADALCIYHSLRIRFSTPPKASKGVKVFVCEVPLVAVDEPIYQMILLKSQTKEEFISILEKKGLIDTTTVERICVPGPGGIRVELSDEVGFVSKFMPFLQSLNCKGMFESAAHRGRL
ncbi:hypothetical protein GCK32_015317 [Trichostrongylus colubriformis]|uniref:FLYWCH-type domain-containing protein n=1 Tax=Trichostrongylus colubriformis TaxID=6319 RepID=A0AAN8IST1_TRICO